MYIRSEPNFRPRLRFTGRRTWIEVTRKHTSDRFFRIDTERDIQSYNNGFRLLFSTGTPKCVLQCPSSSVEIKNCFIHFFFQPEIRINTTIGNRFFFCSGTAYTIRLETFDRDLRSFSKELWRASNVPT